LSGASAHPGTSVHGEPGRFAPVPVLRPLRAALIALQYRHRILDPPPLA